MGPKSVTKSSATPRSMSRSRIVSKSSSDAACRARWSSRPRPNIGVWRSASVFPSIWKTLSSAQSPILMMERRGPSPVGEFGSVPEDLGVEDFAGRSR